MKYYIGIDAGVKKIKVVLFDSFGQEIQIVAVDTDIIANDIERELDMNVYGEKVIACIRYFLEKKIIEPEKIMAIGVSGHGEGLWAIDDAGDPVYNAILSTDKRALSEYEAVNKRIPGLGKRIYANLGNHLSAGSTLLLLKWVKNHRPKIYHQIARVFFAKDWVRYYLTGDVATDITDGSNAFYRIHDGEIPEQLFSILGISEARNWIPPLRSSFEICGTLTPEAAEKTGLPETVPVVTGISDMIATSLGMGTVRPNEIAVVLNGSCNTMINVKRAEADLARGHNHYLRHVSDNMVVDLLSTTNGMTSIVWMQNEVARKKDLSAVSTMAEKAPPGCSGLIYQPLSVRSEDLSGRELPKLRAGYFGIKDATTQAEMVRAVFEGLAYSIKGCLSGRMVGGQITLSGKAADSDFFCQMLSDVLGVPVIVNIGKEFAAKGAMMVAALALGKYNSFEDTVNQCLRIKKIFKPEHRSGYNESYAMFREVETAYSNLWQKWIDHFDNGDS